MKNKNIYYLVLAGFAGWYIYKKLYPSNTTPLVQSTNELPMVIDKTTLATPAEQVATTPAPAYNVKYSISGTRSKLPFQI